MLGDAAVTVFAHDSDAEAERLIADLAVTAFVATDFRIKDSFHAEPQAAVTGCRHNYAGCLHSHDLRQGVANSRAIVTNVQIHSIERRRRGSKY